MLKWIADKCTADEKGRFNSLVEKHVRDAAQRRARGVRPRCLGGPRGPVHHQLQPPRAYGEGGAQALAVQRTRSAQHGNEWRAGMHATCVFLFQHLLVLYCIYCATGHRPQVIGWLVNERFLNLPPQIAPPSLRAVLADAKDAAAEGKPFKFDYIMLVSKSVEIVGQAGGGMSGGGQAKRQAARASPTLPPGSGMGGGEGYRRGLGLLRCDRHRWWVPLPPGVLPFVFPFQPAGVGKVEDEPGGRGV